MADDSLMSQEEIERLLSQSQPSETPPAASEAPRPAESQAAVPPAAQWSTTPDAGSKVLDQNDIDKILGQSPVQPKAADPPAVPVASASLPEGNVASADLDYLLNQAEQALASIQSGSSGPVPPGVTAFQFEELTGAAPSQDNATLDLIRDVELDLKIELGRTNMYLEDVLRLRKGSVVPLDKLAGDPVDIYVNDRLVARGEVLVLNDNFCVRVAELIAGVAPAA